MKIAASKVHILFVCPECGNTAQWAATALDDGTPTCNNCQCDMKVGDEVEIEE